MVMGENGTWCEKLTNFWGQVLWQDPVLPNDAILTANQILIPVKLTSINPPISLLSTVQFSCSVVSDSLRPHKLQHARPPCPSPTPGVYSNSCPSSQWCHPTISSSVVPFSSCSQSFPASGSFQMSQLFTSGGQSLGVFSLNVCQQLSTTGPNSLPLFFCFWF